MNWFSIFSPRAERRCAQRIQKWQAFMGASERERARAQPTFISALISLFTGWAGFLLLLFSGGLPSFSISAMFSLNLCQYLGVKTPRAHTARSEAGPFQSCGVAANGRRARSPSEVDAGAGVAGSPCPVESAIFCLLFLSGLSVSRIEPSRKANQGVEKKKSEPDRGRGLQRNSIRPRWSREGYFLPNFPQIGFHRTPRVAEVVAR